MTSLQSTIARIEADIKATKEMIWNLCSQETVNCTYLDALWRDLATSQDELSALKAISYSEWRGFLPPATA